MRRLLCVSLLFVLALVFCGAPPETTETPTTETDGSKGEAFEVLSEAEFQKWLKVYPIAKVEFEKAGKRIEVKGDENPITALDKYATINKEVAGLDAKLTAAGMPWSEFWPVTAKVMAAIGAYAMSSQLGEGLAEMEAQLKDPNIPDAQKQMIKGILESLKQAQKAYEGVPQQNMDLIGKYWDDLEKLFENE
jgi:hypothetical protein